ncbi:MAG: hypothetical protein JWP27_2791 [Flaviaesturariibacter sp.]|nr:hypothetical protein [Flaviaesturariibacter sp.]
MKQIFLFAALAVATTGFSQKINGKLSFPKGQKLEVTTETKKVNSMEAMGQSMETTVTSTITEVYDVQDASATGATIEHKVKRLVFNMEAPMGGQSFDSEKADDRKGEMGQLLDKKLLKNKYTATLDAWGRITAIKSDDDNPQGKKTEEDEMASMMSQQLGLGMVLPKIGESVNFKLLPEREVGVGDTWSDSTVTGSNRIVRNFKMTGITDSEVALDFTTDSKVEMTQQTMGQEMTVTAVDKATGKITLDRKTGLLKMMTSTSTTEGNIDVQGASIPLTGKSTTTTTVKPM